MKNLIVTAGALLILSSCSLNNSTSKITTLSGDSLVTKPIVKAESKAIYAVLKIKDTIKIGEPVLLKFAVYNPADSAQKFCKWHTPFEPLMSKYVEVKDADGMEVNYKGAMAKRMMPPSASSYIKVNPKDSLTITADLLKAFTISKPSKYTVKYVGQNMSGLTVADSVSFVYIK